MLKTRDLALSLVVNWVGAVLVAVLYFPYRDRTREQLWSLAHVAGESAVVVFPLVVIVIWGSATLADVRGGVFSGLGFLLVGSAVTLTVWAALGANAFNFSPLATRSYGHTLALKVGQPRLSPALL